VGAQAHLDGDGGQVTNGKITATVNGRGWLGFANQHGRVILRELWQVGGGEVETSPLGLPGRELRPVLGDGYSAVARFQADDGERIYGMGQRQIDKVDLKGCLLELAQRNSQANVPFALSSRGYGFLWNNPAIGRVAFAHNVTEWEASRTDQIDYWVTAGDSPAEIEEAYARATGTVPLMPEFATGFWQCKLRYRSQEELLQVAHEYKRRGLPLSVIVADFFHWTRQGEWKFDPAYWPDPEGMVSELKSMGIELMVSIWPTVDVNSENWDEMWSRGYLVRTDRGTPTNVNFMGNQAFFDATHPGARQFVWDKVKQNYYDKGIRVFWLDEAEPELMGHYDFDLIRYHAGPALKVSNIYPLYYARAFYEGMTAAGQQDVLNLVRCCWAGSQRYGALLWSGDIESTFASLRRQLAAGLNAGLSGIPWWTTDIGGFVGGDVGDPEFHELLVRWFQFAVYCPVTRLHGFRKPYAMDVTNFWRDFDEPFGSGAGNELWSFGPDVYDMLKECVLTREALRPYVSAQMTRAHERGTPVMRPLFYDYPDDPRSWEVEDQFLFGPDVVVAPVLYPGVTSRQLYVPPAGDWVDPRTGTMYEAGGTFELTAELATIPVLVRAGAPVAGLLGTAGGQSGRAGS
jgi:alpha-D-xyloside xylohydrolase